MPTLAGNLASRAVSVKANYPGIVVYWLGDTDHQAKQSDHNPDARSIVHAIDCMIKSVAQGNEIVVWVLEDTRDIQYVIFNRTIWSRADNFKPKAYTGSNPHIDHVHISGKHGLVGKNAATGTGYDVAAEKITPEGMSDMTPSQQYVLHVVNYRVDAILHNRATCNVPAFTATDGSKFPAINETNHLYLKNEEILAAAKADAGSPLGNLLISGSISGTVSGTVSGTGTVTPAEGASS